MKSFHVIHDILKSKKDFKKNISMDMTTGMKKYPKKSYTCT
jgi:hypothetical protein